MTEKSGEKAAGEPKASRLKLGLWGVAVVGVAAVLYIIVQASINPQRADDLKSFAKGDMAKFEIPAEAAVAPVTSFQNASGATARIADLIVTGATTSPTLRQRRVANLGELVLGAGRPIIAVGETVTEFADRKIVVAWKDTREARRAVADALPFLQRAQDVIAITVSEGDRSAEKGSLDDLLAWLDRHDVKARAELLENQEGFVDVLESTARAYQADLVVSGGYGHSRMREWLFGGITRNLLEANTLNRLFSN